MDLMGQVVGIWVVEGEREDEGEEEGLLFVVVVVALLLFFAFWRMEVRRPCDDALIIAYPPTFPIGCFLAL